MCQKQWIFELFLLVILVMIHQTSSTLSQLANSCSNTTMFANNSAYQTNLNTLFRSLYTNATDNPSGFYTATVGNPASEAIYGLYLCRGDVNSTTCHDCVNTATTTDLPKKYCPNRKVAIIWYDECMVRYSNQSIFNQLDRSISVIYWSANNIIGNTSRFEDLLENMMNNVIAIQAPRGGSLKKFATAFVNYTIFQTIYGLGQCTPDLTPVDCNQCLGQSIQAFKQTQGGRILVPSCVVRYETYSFFNLSSLPQPPQPPKPSPASNPSPIIEPNGSSGNSKVSTKVIVAIIVGALLTSAALFSICICLFKKKGRKTTGVITAVNPDDQDFRDESLQYELATLQSATNYFSDENKLGEGGFGGVYKGKLSNGQLIAVKRLSTGSSQGIKEFKTEVLLVARLQHRNLVRLLGFCYEEQEKLLVYEYAPNKSLDKFIFDQENRRQLDWPRRYKVIEGIARGLLYLHHDSQLRIIHRDLKAANVLLDDNMTPKISDFGTSRIFGVDHSRSYYTSRVVGTYGYMSPEYALHGQFSVKSDAYSFGVLVLEIISGKRNGNFHQSGDTDDLLSYAWKNWEDGTPLDFVDPTIRDSCVNSNEVMRCLHLGLLCVQESVEDRPTMVTVVLTLDSFSVTLPVPEQPGYYERPRLESTLLKEVGSDDSSSKSIRLSVNELSITETEAR